MDPLLLNISQFIEEISSGIQEVGIAKLKEI